MSLSAEQRELLLNGPGVNGHRHDLVKAFDGSASLWVAWRRHRQELLDLCPHGRRPYGYWLVEERLPFVPRDETAQLRAIRAADCYRSERAPLCPEAPKRDHRRDTRPQGLQPRGLRHSAACTVRMIVGTTRAIGGAEGRTPSPARRSYFLRLRRSHTSAAIEPITPIAASPENASISGTSAAPA